MQFIRQYNELMKLIVGDVIREFRNASKQSQDQLVDKIDMSKSYLSEIENGKKIPSLITIFRIAKALEVNAWEIVKVIEERNS